MTFGPLTRELRANGIKFDAALIQENTTPEQIAKAREMVNNADIVIAGLYGRVRSGQRNSAGLPESGARILRDLIAKNKKVVGVSFGNPYILDAFPQMKTYMVAYGDMPQLQRVGGQSDCSECRTSPADCRSRCPDFIRAEREFNLQSDE